MKRGVSLLLLLVLGTVLPCNGENASPADAAADWVGRFAFVPLAADANAPVPEGKGGLPGFTAVSDVAGPRLVRVSLPFPPGVFPVASGLALTGPAGEVVPDVRVLTVHPGQPVWVRRALVTFVHEFPKDAEQHFSLGLGGEGHAPAVPKLDQGGFTGSIGGLRIEVGRDGVALAPKQADGPGLGWEAAPIAPGCGPEVTPVTEVIEAGRHYLWIRLLAPDPVWPRIIDVQADALGRVQLTAHVQRLSKGDGWTPDLGWQFDLKAKDIVQESTLGGLRITRMTPPDPQPPVLTYREDDHVPQQVAAWRSAGIVVERLGGNAGADASRPPVRVRIAAEAFDAIYDSGVDRPLDAWPVIEAARKYHRETMAGASAPSPDAGNVTGMPTPGVFGMNRLNHCPAIFEEYYRTGDARLRDVALRWCDNFYDLTIWWGTDRRGEFGGTRYNNVSVDGKTHVDDKTFMWRSNTAVHFCTKGYDSFLYAYEETGDPRMAVALRWQLEYAARMIHTDQGECRNIGDVLDFVRLYEFTGEQHYLDQALRLFRELRSKLSPGDLFSQGGQPIVEDVTFMDDDSIGYKHPFAKPYIIGYALQGLPRLARYAPDEPKLHAVIRAVADFMAESQDPCGGWRYPHPRSSRVILCQAMEHAVQVSRAAGWLESRGEPIDKLLDAIERVLQARILGFERSGTFLSGLSGWEQAMGVLKEGQTLYDLYQKPEDRDRSQDYTHGAIGSGSSSPEGVVYFSEVLDFYLRHREASRLFNPTPELAAILERIEPAGNNASGEPEEETDTEYLNYGVERQLPTFNAAQVMRLTFPLAYDPAKYPDFTAWRETARAKLLECLLTPPPEAPFAPAVAAREDRGSYEARKIVFNVSADCRIPAYLLVPKGAGPFPAIVALHDHGAHFSIGKEKVVRPFDVDPTVLEDAQKWVDTCYGGRFIGDELAKRGYVVLAIDALFWGERGRREGVQYEEQQALAANLFQLGMTWVGVVTWDDIRSAAFVASLPEVDVARIGAAGLSMGCHRTWMLSAASDRIAAGAAICWMGTTEALTAPGNNQTKGYSAFSMLVPGLRNYLDYPDVAAMACPKPMLFFNGEKDGLFPVAGVEAAYARMRRVWEAQGVSERLVTKLWPVPHEFNRAMQEEAFAFLDRHLRLRGAAEEVGVSR